MEQTKRKALSKKIRFEVFKRDNFTCQYCSAKTPDVALEIDHILPVCKKGTNDIDNLITACFDCNRGKGKNELASIPETLLYKIEKKKIAQEQYRAYLKLIKDIKKQKEDEIDVIEEIFVSAYSNLHFTDKFRMSVGLFIDKLGIETVMRAMQLACSKPLSGNHATKYFCGICWNTIQGR